MPTVQIDGIGKVKLDDSFNSLPPDQQEATINEIAQSHHAAAPKAAAAPSPTVGDAPAPTPQAPLPPALEAHPGVDPFHPPTRPSTQFNDDWLKQQEEAYQAGKGAPGKVYNSAPSPNQTSALGATGLGAIDGLTFGFGDEIGGALGSIIPGKGHKNVWNGDSLGDSYDANRDGIRDVNKHAMDEHPGYFIGGGLAAGLLPFGAASEAFTAGRGVLNVAKAAEQAKTLTNGERYLNAARHGLGGGALYGLGSGEGDLGSQIDSTARGAVLGAGIGTAAEGLVGTAIRAIPKIKDERFVNREIATNPYGAFDAEIVDDLAKARDATAVSPNDPKGRASLTAKEVNSVEGSYFSEFKNVINQLDMPVEDKLALKSALTDKIAIPQSRLDELPDTVAGRAVADAITKVQRLRKLTPEQKRGTSALNGVANVTDFIPGIPGIVGRGIRAMASATGDGEAARVNAAERLLNRQRAYAKLGEAVGPSGANESKAALWSSLGQNHDEDLINNGLAAVQKAADTPFVPTKLDLTNYRASPDRPDIQAQLSPGNSPEPDYAAILNDPVAAAKRKLLMGDANKLGNAQEKSLAQFDPEAPIAPEAPPSSKDMGAFRQQITDPTPDPRDLAYTAPSASKLASRVQARNAAMAKLDDPRSLSDWEMALNDPTTAPPPVADKPIPKKDLNSFRQQITDPAPDMRDLTNPVTSDRALATRVQARNAAMAKLDNPSAMSDWEAKLADPSTAPQAPKPKADPAQAAIDDAIQNGIQGDSQTQNAFAGRLGVSTDDLHKLLDHIEPQVPDLAGEVNRIRFNYPTRDRKMGAVLAPRMRAAMDELGIKPQDAAPTAPAAVPVDEAAQARLAAATPPAPAPTGAIDEAAQARLAGEPEPIASKSDAPPLSPAKAKLQARLDEIDPVEMELGDGSQARRSELPAMKMSDAERAEADSLRKQIEAPEPAQSPPQIRRVDRPAQWSQGKDRYQTAANNTIADLNDDIRIPNEAMTVLKRVPEKIRDQFKTTKDATDYIENDVVPELQAAKVSNDEIDHVRSYLYEIAGHKPYADQADYEAGTKVNPRGRPRKQ
jgi:hypothetical protein